MTEVEQYHPEHNGHHPLEPQSRLMAWARDASEAHRISQALAKTSFVSTTLRGKPDEVTGAILTGQEVGLDPMSALRSIDVIQGTPAIRAHALRGLVQSRGHEVWVEESTETRAVVCGQRKGSEKVQRSVWTMDRAQRLGLAGKENWKKQPEAMLIARATAEVCRLVASDVLLGLPYAVEELDETTDEPKPKRKAQRKPLPPVEEPPLEEPPFQPSEPEKEDPEERPELQPVASDSGQSGDS